MIDELPPELERASVTQCELLDAKQIGSDFLVLVLLASDVLSGTVLFVVSGELELEIKAYYEMSQNHWGLVVAQEIVSKGSALIISEDQINTGNFVAIKLKAMSEQEEFLSTFEQ